jgi:hypothetical protein
MIDVLLKDVGLFDFDQADVCLTSGEEVTHRHLPELIALRDAPLPSRWIRWWQTLRQKL